MASNNIFQPNNTAAYQPIRKDTTISFEINQAAAASKLEIKLHNACANDAFNLMTEPSAIRDKVSKLRDEILMPLTFGGIGKSVIDSDDDLSYHPDKNDSYDSE